MNDIDPIDDRNAHEEGGRSDERGHSNPRREFLRGALLASASTLFIPSILLGNRQPNGACTPTSADIEGPYYRSGSPFRVALASPTEPGERLLIRGVVYANDCTTPISGVTVDVWAANDEGCYNNNVDCFPHSDDIHNLRGRMLTNEKGEYAFSTIKPGRYLNGATYRPSHIHFRVTAPGASPFITQLYFEGDPYIPTDPWASEDDAEPRIIPLSPVNNVLEGTFDIILRVAPPKAGVYGGPLRENNCELMQNAPNPFDAETMIGYRVAQHDRVELAIFDMLGRRVRTLVSSMHGSGVYTEKWDGNDDAGERLPAGVYTCRMQAGTFVQSRKLVRR